MERQVEALLRGTQFKQILENFVKNLREKYGLKRTEVEVLYYLSQCPEQNTAKDITLSLHMNKGHISQTTKSLCRRGFISAEKDKVDYRIVHYTLTKDARRMIEEIDSAIEKLYNALFEGISAEERDTLGRIASQMASNINRILQ